MEIGKNGKITITDPRMTRFWITPEQGVRFVIWCVENMPGGEVFVPKIPSMNIMDLAAAVAPDCEVEYTGIRAGECHGLPLFLLGADVDLLDKRVDLLELLRRRLRRQKVKPWISNKGWGVQGR